jgi:hypothetical protein
LHVIPTNHRSNLALTRAARIGCSPYHPRRRASHERATPFIDRSARRQQQTAGAMTVSPTFLSLSSGPSAWELTRGSAPSGAKRLRHFRWRIWRAIH